VRNNHVPNDKQRARAAHLPRLIVQRQAPLDQPLRNA
jgi:hypothetical protein